LNNSAKRSCLLYEWIWDPGDWMLRWEVFFRCRRRCCGAVLCFLPVVGDSGRCVSGLGMLLLFFPVFFTVLAFVFFLLCCSLLCLWLVVLPSPLFVCFATYGLLALLVLFVFLNKVCLPFKKKTLFCTNSYKNSYVCSLCFIWIIFFYWTEENVNMCSWINMKRVLENMC
jgi:hypothetical protein